jgi:hypothetical protein
MREIHLDEIERATLEGDGIHVVDIPVAGVRADGLLDDLGTLLELELAVSVQVKAGAQESQRDQGYR